jgi:hypothetical protein
MKLGGPAGSAIATLQTAKTLNRRTTLNVVRAYIIAYLLLRVKCCSDFLGDSSKQHGVFGPNGLVTP